MAFGVTQETDKKANKMGDLFLSEALSSVYKKKLNFMIKGTFIGTCPKLPEKAAYGQAKNTPDIVPFLF